jgi:tetratricopeptide (TPR) repeat protein
MDGPARRNSKVALKANKKRAKAAKAAKVKRGFGKKEKMLAGAVGLALLAAGGVYGMQFFQGEQAKEQLVKKASKLAVSEIASDKDGHWDRAIKAALEFQKADPKSIEAGALLGEAHYAAAMDNGTGAEEHMKAGSAAVTAMRRLKGKNSHVALAEGLHSMAANQFEDAVRHLTAGSLEDKANPSARLYLAWAYAAKHDHSNAVASYDAVLQSQPDRIAALYGKGGSLVYLGKHAEATESFLAAIKAYRKLNEGEHIGSQLGIAQLVEVENFGDRELRYLEILRSPDIETKDTRIVALAWVLAANEARKAGRVAVAEERLSHAAKLDPGSMEVIVGQAAVAFDKGETEEAAAKLNAVLSLAPGHLRASLLFVEVSIAQGDNERASNKLADLLDIEPKIEYRPILSRMELLRGRILATDESGIPGAEEAYKKAFELSDDGGAESSLELAELYNRLERPEDAVATLAPLKKKAKKDPALAVILGVAYLSAKDPAQAINIFLVALSQQPGDAEARFQLGRALAMAGRQDEAITELQRAYKDSEQREDIGLELAEIYRRMERHEEASELYKKILAAETPSRNARANAGNYFARMGDYEQAGAIAVLLLENDPKDPSGLFLSGEALFQAGEYGKAKDLFKEASKLDPLPQYQDALGRAYEKLLDMTKSARAYEMAIKGDPTYIQPRLGLANVHFIRKEYTIVIDELTPALKIDPRHVQIHYQIGRSHLEMREPDLALAALMEAVKVDPNHGLSHMTIGLAYAAKGDQKSAAVAYKRATRTTGNDEAKWLPEAYRLLGYALRESAGPTSEQCDAWTNYLDRVEIEDAQSAEVKKLVIPMRCR